MIKKLLILMRGFPACGKSFRAKQLAKDKGLIFSTDEYWYKMVEPDEPEKYSFKPTYLAHAHYWNQQRAYRSIEMGIPLIIIDNTNTTISEMKPYVVYGVCQDYEISFEEPTSPWWLEIKELLKNKEKNREQLQEWSLKLEEKSRDIHNVPAFAIEKMMRRWELEPTVEKIMAIAEIDKNGFTS